MSDKKTTPHQLKDGRTADAKIESWLSPTGAFEAEWNPELNAAWPLTNQDGEYIPVRPGVKS